LRTALVRFNSRLVAQERKLPEFVEQRLGLFEVGGVEAVGESVVDWC
jgi:hypothetical protein